MFDPFLKSNFTGVDSFILVEQFLEDALLPYFKAKLRQQPQLWGFQHPYFGTTLKRPSHGTLSDEIASRGHASLAASKSAVLRRATRGVRPLLG